MRFKAADELDTDFTSHHIEGIAAHGHTHFKVSLISEILPGLWQGGCIDNVELPHDFDMVISLYPWEQYKLGPNTERMEITAYDSHDVPDVILGVELAHARWKAGQKVLIHCQAGLNRSGLTAAQVLMKEGYTAQEAIDMLRTSRCSAVLCNRTFEKHLLELDDAEV